MVCQMGNLNVSKRMKLKFKKNKQLTLKYANQNQETIKIKVNK